MTLQSAVYEKWDELHTSREFGQPPEVRRHQEAKLCEALKLLSESQPDFDIQSLIGIQASRYGHQSGICVDISVLVMDCWRTLNSSANCNHI